MTLSTVAVLRPGDWVHYDGSEHQVLALAGTSVRLRTVDGADSVLLAGHLMASPRFAVVDSEPAPSVEREDGVGVHREWTRRAEVLIPPGIETATFSASRLFAAVYPEAVRLAGLIASPTWRHLAAGDADQQRQFTTEVGRRLDRPHHPGDGGDAVAH